jgi:rubrerythrin
MSSLLFNANEVFEIAKRIERNGVAYYRSAADLMTDAELKKLMLDLAEMEVTHEQIFAHLQQRLAGNEVSEPLYDPHGETFEFLKRMADKYVFDPNENAKNVLKPGIDAKTVLGVAIQREKDSVIFYEGIKVMVPEKYGRSRIDEIILQEMGHVMILSRQLEKL